MVTIRHLKVKYIADVVKTAVIIHTYSELMQSLIKLNHKKHGYSKDDQANSLCVQSLYN
jgi:hypothetical protein